MELRHLRYFTILADELNFTRAAARLNIAQSALSIQIKHLEEEVGTRLILRERRSTRLTEAGQAFLEQASKSLAGADAAVTAARRAASGEVGSLSIGHNTPAEFRVFRKVVPLFTETHPGVRLELHNMRNVELIDALRSDRVDIIFDWAPPFDHKGFEAAVLCQEPLVALIPENHRLAARDSVSIKDLSGEPMVMFPKAHLPDAYREIEQLFLAAGAVFHPVHELDTALSIMNFVAMGAGCSLLPDFYRRVQCEGMVYKSIAGPNPFQSLAIIKKSGRGGLAQQFFDFTVAHMRSEAGRA